MSYQALVLFIIKHNLKSKHSPVMLGPDVSHALASQVQELVLEVLAGNVNPYNLGARGPSVKPHSILYRLINKGPEADVKFAKGSRAHLLN